MPLIAKIFSENNSPVQLFIMEKKDPKNGNPNPPLYVYKTNEPKVLYKGSFPPGSWIEISTDDFKVAYIEILKSKCAHQERLKEKLIKENNLKFKKEFEAIIKEYASNKGFTVFPAILENDQPAFGAYAVIGFMNFNDQHQAKSYFDQLQSFTANLQVFKMTPDEKSMLAIGHPHTTIKNLVGVERGDYLDFQIVDDLYHSGILIISNNPPPYNPHP